MHFSQELTVRKVLLFEEIHCECAIFLHICLVLLHTTQTHTKTFKSNISPAYYYQSNRQI